MSNSIYLGIDIGTTSAKCLAVDDNGKTIALTQKEYPISHPRQGWAIQNPDDYWQALTEIIPQCVTMCEAKGYRKDAIVSMALSSQGDTVIPLSSENKPLCGAISWMDSRADAEYRELVESQGAGYWVKETGQPLYAVSSACKLKWLAKNQPDVFNKIARVCYVPDYITYLLTGKFVIDASSASWTPLYSPRQRAWSEQVLSVLELSLSALPEVKEAVEDIGKLRPAICQQLNLPEGVTMKAGAFDQTAAGYGAGAEAGKRALLSCGTAWVLYLAANQLPDDTGLLPICCHVSSNEWGYVLPFPGGGAYDWLRQILGTGHEPAITGNSPLVFIPHLYGGLSPDWISESRGSLIGLTMAHTKDDIQWAMQRGIAFEAKRNLTAAEKLSGKVKTIRITGGASKSSSWMRLIANTFNRQIEISDFTESACLGAARIACGMADWDNNWDFQIIEPDANGVEQEEQNFNEYLKIYNKL